MRNRRRLFVLLAVTAAMIAAVGSGSFTSTTADRSVTVDVVGDENAYMALEYAETREEVHNGTTPSFLTVTNQFTQDIDVTVQYRVASDGADVDRNDGTLETTDLGVGDAQAFSEFTLTCDANATDTQTATVHFDVTAEGTDVFAETSDSRQVTYEVDCEAMQSASMASTNDTTEGPIETATETATETETE